MAFICQTNRFPSFLFQFGCTVWCDCENFYRVIWSNSSDTNLLIVFGWFHMYAFCLICAMVSCALNMIRVPWQSEKNACQRWESEARSIHWENISSCFRTTNRIKHPTQRSEERQIFHMHKVTHNRKYMPNSLVVSTIKKRESDKIYFSFFNQNIGIWTTKLRHTRSTRAARFI